MPRSAQDVFPTVFHRPAEVVVRAPGRVNLIGEHVDYLGGMVFPVAIDLATYAAAAKNGTDEVRVWTDFIGSDPVSIALGDLHPRRGKDAWLNYVAGVLALIKGAGREIPGFDAVFTSEIPVGAGLSSSAALETATALLVEAVTGEGCDPVSRAQLCQRAEHEFAGMPCGIMDQLAVGACREGHALLIDCQTLALHHHPMPKGVAIVVADTGVKHVLGDGEYRRRRDDCEAAAALLGVSGLREVSLEEVAAAAPALGDRLLRRARHGVTEMARVPAFAEALASGDFAEAGRLMAAGHDSLRDDFEVSCPELDALVEAARDFGSGRGLIGSRMTGGGFGGATVSLVREGAAPALRHHLESAFREKFGRHPQVFITQAAGGASVLKAPPGSPCHHFQPVTLNDPQVTPRR